MGLLKSAFGSLALLDSQVIVYTVLALIPNLFLILWAMARLSREVRLLKSKAAMAEDDINLLDQSISNLTAELQALRKSDHPIAVAHASAAKKEG